MPRTRRKRKSVVPLAPAWALPRARAEPEERVEAETQVDVSDTEIDASETVLEVSDADL